MGEHAGLAAAGAGEDQQRPVRGRDRARLLGVQPPDDLLPRGEPAMRSRLDACSASSWRRTSAVSSGGCPQSARRTATPALRGGASLVGKLHECGAGLLRGVVQLGAGALRRLEGVTRSL